jgi:RNA-directed DNA polymerase
MAAGWGGGLVVVRARERRAHGEGDQQVGQEGCWNARRTLVNTGDLELLGLSSAERRVLEIQAKLHRWARDDAHRRFCDLFNLGPPR